METSLLIGVIRSDVKSLSSVLKKGDVTGLDLWRRRPRREQFNKPPPTLDHFGLYSYRYVIVSRARPSRGSGARD